MRTMFKTVVALLLLLPFLAGTIGISAREHICKSSNKTSIKFYPEISGKLVSCCGSDDGLIASPGMGSEQQTLDTPYCCKTIQLFLKANFQTSQLETAVLLNTSGVFILAVTAGILNNNSSFSKPVSFFSDTGPPPSGRQRVLNFHQPKIPNPATLLC